MSAIVFHALGGPNSCPGNDHAGLERLAALVDAGALRLHVGHTIALAAASEAHRIGEAGRAAGKIVLVPGTGR